MEELGCEVCGELETKYCRKCKKVKYCSQKCQEKDWEKHKEQCGKCHATFEEKAKYIKMGFTLSKADRHKSSNRFVKKLTGKSYTDLIESGEFNYPEELIEKHTRKDISLADSEKLTAYAQGGDIKKEIEKRLKNHAKKIFTYLIKQSPENLKKTTSVAYITYPEDEYLLKYGVKMVSCIIIYVANDIKKAYALFSQSPNIIDDYREIGFFVLDPTSVIFGGKEEDIKKLITKEDLLAVPFEDIFPDGEIFQIAKWDGTPTSDYINYTVKKEEVNEVD